MTAGWPVRVLDALSRELAPGGLGSLLPRLAAEFPAYDFGTQRTYSGVSLVAVCRDGAAHGGTYAVITSDPGEMREVLSHHLGAASAP
jgi:hypothetical protein